MKKSFLSLLCLFMICRPCYVQGQVLKLSEVCIRMGKLHIEYLHNGRDTVRFPFFVGIDEVVNSKKLPSKYYRIKNDTLRLIFSSRDNFFHFAGVQVHQKANEVLTADFLGHNIGNWKNGNLFYPDGYEPNEIKMGYREKAMMEIPLPVKKPFNVVYIRYDSFEYVGALCTQWCNCNEKPKNPFGFSAYPDEQAILMLRNTVNPPLSKVCTRDSMLHLEYINTSRDTLYFPYLENADTGKDIKPLMYSHIDNGLLYLSVPDDKAKWATMGTIGKPCPVLHTSQYILHANAGLKYPAPGREAGTKLAPGDKVIIEMKTPTARPFAGLVINYGRCTYIGEYCAAHCKCK